MLGDYRNNANDGRFHGMVPRSDLVGPLTVLYASLDPETFAPRWSRFWTTPR